MRRTGFLNCSAPLKRGAASLRRTGFRKPQQGCASATRESTLATPVPPHLRARATTAVIGSAVAARPKSARLRNQAVLDMANNRPCLLLAPGVARHERETTVACHSNSSAHGKAGTRKADDHYSVWGCAVCHTWLDSSQASQALKVSVFAVALKRQIKAWQQISVSQQERQRARNAALWALAQHGVAEC